MASAIIQKIATLSSNGQYFGEIVKVIKPTFPRSGKMDKKGIYEAWNAKISPFASRIIGERYYWDCSLEKVKQSINRRFPQIEIIPSTEIEYI